MTETHTGGDSSNEPGNPFLRGSLNAIVKVNDGMENSFGSIGRCVARCPYIVLGTVVSILILFICLIPVYAESEDDLFELWTPTDSPFSIFIFYFYFFFHKNIMFCCVCCLGVQ